MKLLSKTILILLFSSAIVSCEFGLKKEDAMPSKNPNTTLDSGDGNEKPPKP